jgi:hypothetical protein
MRPFPWNLTASGLLLTCLGWSGLWGEALLQSYPLPLALLAALFFLGLALGAYDQRRRSRRRQFSLQRNKCGLANLRAYREEKFLPPRFTG